MINIEENKNLKNLNTFDVSAQAEKFAKITSEKDLHNLENELKKEVYILGGGSNILMQSKIDGLVLKNEITGKKIIQENEDSIKIKIGSGENWDEFVKYCVKNEYYGIENLALIPGTIGGAVIQNAGAYGTEIKEVINKVNAFDLDTLEQKVFSNEECKFSYRDSIFKKENFKNHFITSIEVKLSKKKELNLSYGSLKQELKTDPSIKQVYDAVVKIRNSKLPNWKKTGTAGSFFKNPFVNKEKLAELKNKYEDIPNFEQENKIKLSAGWLIDQIQNKLPNYKQIKPYKNHALIIINKDNATGEKIYEYSNIIKQKVNKKFGIELEREVRLW